MLSFEWEQKNGPGLLGEKTQFGWTPINLINPRTRENANQIESNFSREETEENPQAYMSTCG